MAVKSKYPDVSIKEVSWMEFVYHNFESYGDKTAIVDGCSGVSYTYFQLYELTRKCSSALRKRDLSKGDVIALFCPNLPEYPLIIFAVTALGGIVTTINPSYTSEELAKRLIDSETKYVFTVPELLQKSRRACAKAHLAVSHIFVVGEAKGCETLSTLLEEESDSEATTSSLTSSDVAFLPYSSGITDLPKGVLLTHRNLVAGCSIASVKGIFDFDGTSVVLGILPFFHSYGMITVLSLALHNGGKVICVPSIKREAILELIEQHKITHAPLVPPLITELAQNPRLEEYDLSSLVCIFSGASKLRQETVKKLKVRLSHIKDIRQGYGMTEISSVSHLCPALVTNDDNKPDSVGVLLPNMECKVLSVETGETLQDNKDGELLVRGPTVMKGYFNNPEATALKIDNEGWLHTGDIGHYDNYGHFYIVDRREELIKCGGFRVSPHEFENILISHPDIEDAAVIGLPEVDEGEVPKAFIVKSNCGLTEEDVTMFLSERVEPFKQLRGGVEFIAEIPKSFSGKILRRLLQERELLKLLNEVGENESDEDGEEEATISNEEERGVVFTTPVVKLKSNELQEKSNQEYTTNEEKPGMLFTTPVVNSKSNEPQEKSNQENTSNEEKPGVSLTTPVLNSKSNDLQKKSYKENTSSEEEHGVVLTTPTANSKSNKLQDEPKQLNDQNSNMLCEQPLDPQVMRANSTDTNKKTFVDKADSNQDTHNHNQAVDDVSRETAKSSRTCTLL